MLATTKDRVYEIENENPTEELMNNDPMKQLVDIGQVEEPLEEPVDQNLALQPKDKDPVETPINTNSEFANRTVEENVQEKNPAAGNDKVEKQGDFLSPGHNYISVHNITAMQFQYKIVCRIKNITIISTH